MNEIYKELDVKNLVFLSFFSENYEKYVKAIHNFLASKEIPFYCMKNNVTNESNLYTSNNFVDEEAKAIKKTSLFIAFIDNAYFNSEECRRECDLIKKEIESSVIKPKFMIFYIDIKCQDSIIRQSWYLSSLHNDRNIYEDLNTASYETICNTILCEYQYKEIEFLNYKYHYEKLMSNVILNSLKGEYECTTVSDYILTSKELTCQQEGYELHIITDEIYNYDCTALSSMAIASNIQKKVKYIYYGSSTNSHLFDTLKEIIKCFIAKDEKSRRRVDRYIRYKFEKKHNIIGNIDFLAKLHYEVLYNALTDEKRKILKKYKTLLFKKEIFNGFDNLKCWLLGEDNDYYKYQNIQILYKFLSEILYNEEHNEYYLIKELKFLFSYLKPLIEFSDWHIGQTTLSEDKIRELEDQLDVQEEIRDWIGYEGLSGQNRLDQEQIDEIVAQNMIYIEINQNDNLPMITHSFCLFFDKSSIRCAWYRTSSLIGTFTGLSIDNNLIIYNVPENEKRDFINMYYKIMNSSKDIQSKLQSVDSRVYEFLRKVVCNYERNN